MADEYFAEYQSDTGLIAATDAGFTYPKNGALADLSHAWRHIAGLQYILEEFIESTRDEIPDALAAAKEKEAEAAAPSPAEPTPDEPAEDTTTFECIMSANATCTAADPGSKSCPGL
jgi:hypothetical protein